MNEIDLWHEAENCEYADDGKLENIAYELYKLFDWSDYPTAEDDFDEIYNRIWEGESLDKILINKGEQNGNE